MEPEEVKSEEPVGGEEEEEEEEEEEAPETELTSEQQMLHDLGGSGDGVAVDEAATLAELWPSRKPKSDSSTTSGKVRKTVRKKKSMLKTRKRRSNSTPKLMLSLRSGKSRSHEKYTSPDNGPVALNVIKSAAKFRAEEVRSSLDSIFPSFVKVLVRSHVGGCFFMGLPGPFCRAYLPHEDTTVVVEGENGKQYDVKYIGHKTGLSAGWRQFSVEHNLLEGDALVFQLVEASKFKVHIIKAGNSTEVEHAKGFDNLDPPAEIPETCTAPGVTIVCKPDRRKRPKSLPLSILQKKKKKSHQQNPLTPETGRSAEQSGNQSEEVGSEVLESSKLSAPKIHFKDVATFENFKILIDGVLLDSEFLEDTRLKYYDLCHSQNEFLHENLMEGINLKLIVGAISEIVSISDAIRACDLTTSRDMFSAWDRTLNAFELLGMNVGFLRGRLKRLTSLAFESENAVEARKLAEAKSKRAFVEDEIRKLELRLLDLEEANEILGVEIGSLRPRVETYELEFREQVNAPW